LSIPVRTITTPNSYDLAPPGRSAQLNHIYVGFVKETADEQKMGRLKVWIPELGGDPNEPSNWFTMQYASPFGGASSPVDNTQGSSYSNSQRSYGMWFVPPHKENEVLCCFINGDPSRGVWFASLFQQYMNHMVPALAGTTESNGLPVGEYNKADAKVNPQSPQRPTYDPLATALKTQGLDKDPVRGTTTVSARSDTQQGYGILSPEGNQFVISDDPANKFIRLRTQSGTQVLVNDTEGMVYINSRDGKSYIELANDGTVLIYGYGDVAVRSQANLNLLADFDIRMEAGRSIYMKARGSTATTASPTNIPGQTQDPEQPDQSGQIQSANSTNTAKVPEIKPSDTSATVTVSTNNIKGIFSPGMLMTGIPWTPPVATATAKATATSPQTSSPVSPLASRKLAARGVVFAATDGGTVLAGPPAVLIGDDVAVGTGSYLASLIPGLVTKAQNGASASTVATQAQASSVQNSSWAFVSVGTNSFSSSGKGNTTSFTTALQDIRDNLNAGNYTWILPRSAAANDLVKNFAEANGDRWVDIAIVSPGSNLPKNPQGYQQLAKDCNSTVSMQLPAPTNTPSVVNPDSATPSAASTPPTQVSSVVDNGDGTTSINVTFPPGNQAPATNSASISGSQQPATNTDNAKTQNNVTNADSIESGIIMFYAEKDVNIKAARDLMLASENNMSRYTKGNLFDTAFGSIDVASGGYMSVTTNGALSLGTLDQMTIGGKRVDINGPSPTQALIAPVAREPIDGGQPNINVLGNGNFESTTAQTVATTYPTHQPYTGSGGGGVGDQHSQNPDYTNKPNSANGTPIDPATGKPIRPGATSSDAPVPMTYVGKLDPNGQSGIWQGVNYDSKGNPIYNFAGASTDLKPAQSFTISPAGIAYIWKWEGFANGYKYPDGKGFSIGYGHYLHPDEVAGNYVVIGGKKRSLTAGPLSRDEAAQLFADDIIKYERDVWNNVRVPITQTQFDMLCSIDYNNGAGNRFPGVGYYGIWQLINAYAGPGKLSQAWLNANKNNANVAKRRANEWYWYSHGGALGTGVAS
jgi:GH24 family phage-related lysozyme (muramidase)